MTHSASGLDSCVSITVTSLQALAQSMAIDTALGHILAVPEPLAVEQSLASFLRVLMQEQGSQAQKLASAIVGIAAAAAKDKGKVILLKTLLFSVPVLGGTLCAIQPLSKTPLSEH